MVITAEKAKALHSILGECQIQSNKKQQNKAVFSQNYGDMDIGNPSSLKKSGLKSYQKFVLKFIYM